MALRLLNRILLGFHRPRLNTPSHVINLVGSLAQLYFRLFRFALHRVVHDDVAIDVGAADDVGLVLKILVGLVWHRLQMPCVCVLRSEMVGD